MNHSISPNTPISSQLTQLSPPLLFQLICGRVHSRHLRLWVHTGCCKGTCLCWYAHVGGHMKRCWLERLKKLNQGVNKFWLGVQLGPTILCQSWLGDCIFQIFFCLLHFCLWHYLSDAGEKTIAKRIGQNLEAHAGFFTRSMDVWWNFDWIVVMSGTMTPNKVFQSSYTLGGCRQHHLTSASYRCHTNDDDTYLPLTSNDVNGI